MWRSPTLSRCCRSTLRRRLPTLLTSSSAERCSTLRIGSRWSTRFGRLAFPVLGLLLAVACAPTPQGSPSSAGEAQKPAQAKRVVAAIQSNPPTLSAEQVGAGSGTLQGGDGLEDLVNGGMSMLN